MKFFSKYLLLCPVLCILLMNRVFAQQEEIIGRSVVYHGTVMDDQQKPLPGVSVFIQEKRGQTQTNKKGEFDIKGDKNDVLIVKMPGYFTSQLVLNNGDSLRITLHSASAGAE